MRRVQLYAPTLFAPSVAKALHAAESRVFTSLTNEVSGKGHEYTVLLIITDGVIDDMVMLTTHGNFDVYASCLLASPSARCFSGRTGGIPFKFARSPL